MTAQKAWNIAALAFFLTALLGLTVCMTPDGKEEPTQEIFSGYR